MGKKRVIVAITGASGTIIGIHLLKILLRENVDIFCIVSTCAKKIIADEIENATDVISALKIVSNNCNLENIDNIKLLEQNDFYAPPASGSFYFDAMAIVPCSMNSLGKLANSIADNLIIRSADVALKERRRLVICPRETPLALTHLQNMCKLSQAGAIIQPPLPAFYAKPKTVDDIAEFIAARIAQSMGFRTNLIKEWGL